MLKEQANLLNKMSIALDLLLVVGAFVLAYFVRVTYMSGDLGPIKEYVWLLLVALPIWYYLFAKYRLYESMRRTRYAELLYRIFSIHIIAAFVMSALVLFFDRDYFSRRFLLLFILFAFILLLVSRVVLKASLVFVRRRGFNYRELLIVGATERAESFIRLVEDHVGWGLRVCGVLQVSSGQVRETLLGYPVLGRLDDLLETCKSRPVDEVVFCLAKDQIVDIEECLKALEEIGVTVRVLLDFYAVDSYRRDLSFFEETLPILTFHSKSLDAQQLMVKRVMDVCGSMLGLCVGMLLFPFIAMAIKMESPGPVLFSQDRIGESGRMFRIWKFRSMYDGAEARKAELQQQNEMQGAIFKIRNDPRVTRIGRVLRKTSLDEFPQFWNVLRGEMSLVGTRPPTPDEVARYENWHRRRMIIKPGLTGLWQVSGRNRVDDFDQVVKYDLRYIDEWSVGLDFRILWKTFWVVIAGRGSC